jgi:hypothetical protein
VDPTNPNHLIAATTQVYESWSGGTAGTWSPISPEFPQAPGGYVTQLVMGQQAGQTGIMLAGTYFGTVWITTNGGSTWTEMTGNLPAWNAADDVWPNYWIAGLAFNPSNIKEAWVAISALNVGHVWHTTDDTQGASTVWTSLDGSGATAIGNEVISSVVLNPFQPGTIYVGTYYGVYACSACTGSSPSPSWSRLGTGLPNAYVRDLTISFDKTTLLAWTHGRGVWTLPLPGGPPPRVYLPIVKNAATGP